MTLEVRTDLVKSIFSSMSEELDEKIKTGYFDDIPISEYKRGIQDYRDMIMGEIRKRPLTKYEFIQLCHSILENEMNIRASTAAGFFQSCGAEYAYFFILRYMRGWNTWMAMD